MSSAGAPAGADIYMPQLGLTMTEGKVVRWLKAPGDPVAKGEPVVEIETDKVTAEVEAPRDGFLGPILAGAGSTVPIGGVLSHVLAAAEIEPASGSGQPAAEKAARRVSASPLARRRAAELGVDPAQVKASGPGGRVVEADVRWFADHLRTPAAAKASPLARRTARDLGVDLAAVQGSGPGGRILEEDVQKAAASARPGAGLATQAPAAQPPRPLAPEPAVPPEGVEPLSGLRRVVAERMAHSFSTAPHFYLSAEAEASSIVRMREGLLARVEAASGTRLTITDILLKLCALALRDFPEVNVSWYESAGGAGLRRHPEVNVGLAVSVDGGLVVPVVRGADRLTLSQIARRRAELVEKARAGKLALTDLEEGTFTLSNLGMFGVDQFQAVLNPPQAAILAVGRIKDRPIAVGGTVAVRPTMLATLTVDHRALDGAQGARFLERVVQLIQEPYLLVD